MITTVCLNPAIDKRANVNQLLPTEVNRLRNIHTMAGGKGINVAVALKRLGAELNCIGVVGEADERFFTRAMEYMGVDFRPITVPGNVRCNLKIVDDDSRCVTEFNEQGATVDAAALDKLTKELYVKAESSSIIALCGSLPPGCDADTYQNLMQIIPAKRWVVDTSGAPLRYALKEKPYLIKPNLAELKELMQTDLVSQEDIRHAAVKLCREGIKHVVVSMGGEGALLTDGTKTVFAPAVVVPVKSTVGAGDAMLAGILYGMEQGDDVFSALRYGIAAGAACVQNGGVEAFTYDEVMALLPQVTVTEM